MDPVLLEALHRFANVASVCLFWPSDLTGRLVAVALLAISRYSSLSYATVCVGTAE